MGCQSSAVVVSVPNLVNTDIKVFTDEDSTVLVSTAIRVVVMRMKKVTDRALSEDTNFWDVENRVTGTVSGPVVGANQRPKRSTAAWKEC